jgi:hypothetical protein
MTPEQAGAALDRMSAALRPAPAPLVPSNLSEALQRRAELSSDPAFLKAYFDGSIDARRQMAALDRMIADASAADVLSGGPDAAQLVEVTDGATMQLTRRQLIGVAADMRAEGVFNEEGIALILNDGKFSVEDTYAAQWWLGQMERDETLLYPDLGGTREQQLKFFKTIATIGTGDTP